MGATVQCKNAECRQWLQVPDELRGKMGRCPACGHEFRVSGTLEPAQTLDPQRFSHLRVEAGPDLLGQFIELRPDKLYEFGNADSCTYQLPGRSVSRHHFLVQWVNDQWTISDLNSTNGTFVNGVRTGRSVLRDSDEIVVGKYRMRFAAPRHGATAAVSATEIHANLPSVQPTARPTAQEAELKVAPDEQAGPPSDTWHETVLEAQSAAQSVQARLLGIDDSAARIKAQELEVSKQYGRWLLVRLALVLLVLVAAGGISKIVYQQVKWRPEKQETVQRTPGKAPTLPTETRTRIEEHIDLASFDEAEQLMAQAAVAGATDQDLAPLRDRLRRAKELLTVSGKLEGLAEQARTAVGASDWPKANKLLNEADTLLKANPDLPTASRNDELWRELREVLRTGPIDQLVASSREKLGNGDYEQAYAEAERAAGMDPGHRPAADWLAELRSRIGAGLDVESPTPGATVRIDGRQLGPVGTRFWQLREGQSKLTVDSPEFMPHEKTVTLICGRLCTVEVSLGPANECRLCRKTGKYGCRACFGTGKSICSHCDGKRKVVCPDCNGHWKNTCSRCDGRGKIEVRKTCSRCNGTGSVTTRTLRGRTTSERCGKCKGARRVTDRDRCPVCQGKRYVLNCHRCKQGQIVCPTCGGTRRHGVCPTCSGTHRVDCPRCSGIGKVPAEQEQIDEPEDTLDEPNDTESEDLEPDEQQDKPQPDDEAPPEP
ncbi:MAG TPA: FHA domain-containing protein [Phycisphaerae bacterium]|nr:FHA domain-containing protein [Phycisphaerae bacterium]